MRPLLFGFLSCHYNVQNHDKNHKYYRQRSSCSAEKLISGLSFSLGEKGFRRTGDGAGQALVLSGLQENKRDQNQSDNRYDNTQYDFQCSHRKHLRIYSFCPFGHEKPSTCPIIA